MSDTGNLLTPEEIEALSAGVADGSVEVDTGFNLNARVAKHDLASEDSSVGINLSAIDMINERFVRLFRLGGECGSDESPARFLDGGHRAHRGVQCSR